MIKAYIFLLLFPFLVECMRKPVEIVRGPRLSWYGLPTDGGETPPIIPGNPTKIGLCWNYGKNKEINKHLYRIRLHAYNSKGLLTHASRVDEEYRKPSGHDLDIISVLPDDLSTCYIALIRFPDVKIDDDFDYQLVFQKYDSETWEYRSYGSTLTLKPGAFIRSGGKFKAAINYAKNHPKISLAVGTSVMAANAALQNYPFISIGFVFFAVGVYEILAGPKISWYGLPTEMSNMKPFLPLSVSKTLICWNRGHIKHDLTLEEFRLVLDVTQRRKSTVYNVKGNFKHAKLFETALKSEFLEIPKLLDDCYVAEFEIPEIKMDPHKHYYLKLVRRRPNGKDETYEALELKPGYRSNHIPMKHRMANVGTEIILNTGPILVVVGAMSANIPLIAVGLVVVGIGAALLVHHLSPSTFRASRIIWHGLPNAESPPEQLWKPETSQEMVFCWRRKPFYEINDEKRLSLIFTEYSNARGNVIASMQPKVKKLERRDTKEEYKDIQDINLCYELQFEVPKYDLDSKHAYSLHMRLITDDSMHVADFEPLMFGVSRKGMKRHIAAELTKQGFQKTGTYYLASGIAGANAIYAGIGLACIAVAVGIAQFQKHDVHESSLDTFIESVAKSLA